MGNEYLWLETFKFFGLRFIVLYLFNIYVYFLDYLNIISIPFLYNFPFLVYLLLNCKDVFVDYKPSEMAWSFTIKGLIEVRLNIDEDIKLMGTMFGKNTELM